MNWGAEFTARFAPINEWHRVDGIEERFTEAAFENQGLSKYPEARRAIPVVLRHEEEQVVGAVEAVWPMEGWWHARFKLKASLFRSCIAADVLEVGTPVSPGFLQVKWRDNGASRQYEQAWLTELSILMHRQRPAYRGAQVTFIREPPPPQMSTEELLQKARSLKPITPSSPAAVPDRSVAGDTYNERPPVWAKLERLVGYKVDDHNFEQALGEAKRNGRSSLDRLYEEHVAAKRQRQPQVLVRHGCGQVIGVR